MVVRMYVDSKVFFGFLHKLDKNLPNLKKSSNLAH